MTKRRNKSNKPLMVLFFFLLAIVVIIFAILLLSESSLQFKAMSGELYFHDVVYEIPEDRCDVNVMLRIRDYYWGMFGGELMKSTEEFNFKTAVKTLNKAKCNNLPEKAVMCMPRHRAPCEDELINLRKLCKDNIDHYNQCFNSIEKCEVLVREGGSKETSSSRNTCLMVIAYTQDKPELCKETVSKGFTDQCERGF